MFKGLILKSALCLTLIGMMAATEPATAQVMPSKGTSRGSASATRLPHRRVTSGDVAQPPIKAHAPERADVPDGTLVLYSSYVKDYKGGFCHFTVDDAASSWTSDYESYSIMFNSGTFKDGKYYATSYDEQYDETPSFYVYDTGTFKQQVFKYTGKSDCANDLTYDPSTDAIYGIFYNISRNAYEFGRLNKSTGNQINISDIPTSVCMRPLGIASTEDGNIYVIGFGPTGGPQESYYSTYLFKVNPTTGEFTQVGPTGIDCSTFLQTACVDSKTNKLYWAGLERDDNVMGGVPRLFEVDMATGAATLKSNLPADIDIIGIYSITSSLSDNVPAAASDIALNFEGASKTGTISFTAPNQNMGGNPISGNLSYEVTFDGTSITGTAEAGKQVSRQVSVAGSGEHTFAVSFANAEGNGKVASATQYIGYAVPDKPKAVDAALGENGLVTITITPPAKGVGNGGFVAEDLKYNIVRYPDGKVVAEAASGLNVVDKLELGELTAYTYGVRATIDGLTGEERVSDKVCYGNPLELPYEATFETAADADFYTFIDANHDGNAWHYYNSSYEHTSKNKCLLCSSIKKDVPKDDYAVTPPLHLRAGVKYFLQYDYLSRGTAINDFPESYRVVMGNAPTVEALTTVIVPQEDEIRTSTEWVTHPEVAFTVEADGAYYIAFHNNTVGQKYEFCIKNIKIKGIDIGAPAPMANLTAKPAADGSAKVTLAGTYPTTTFDGKPLDALKSVIISRNGTEVDTLTTDILPGGKMEYVDDAAAEGVNEYEVCVTNEGGVSEKAAVKTFTGFDRPAAVAGLTAKETSTGEVTLTWTAPVAGEHMGNIKSGELRYRIVRIGIDGKPIAETATGLTETKYVDVPELDGQQDIAAYKVYASTAAGEGVAATTTPLHVGKPYAVPFVESFANGTFTTKPWIVTEQDGVTWQPYQDAPDAKFFSSDGDNGMIGFKIAGLIDRQADITSPKITVRGGENPRFTIKWAYSHPEPKTRSVIQFQISRNGGEFTTFHTLDEDQAENPTLYKWFDFTFPLDEYLNDDYIQIRLHGEVHNTYGGATYFDRFSVADRRNYDLQCTGLTGPATLKPGEEGSFVATVKNVGMNAVSDWSVDLCKEDGTVVATANGDQAINANRSVTVALKARATVFDGGALRLYAKVSSPSDNNSANNSSTPVKVLVSTLPYPTVNDLAIEVVSEDKSSVTLGWSAPQLDAYVPQPVVDEFEAYADFSISGFGDWRVLDGDNLPTYPFANPSTQEPCEYPYSTSPKAWQVFNPFKVAGLTAPSVPLDEKHSLYPHSGEKYLIAFAAYSPDESVTPQNDDWLFSPQLSGDKQTVSFYARSVNNKYTEKFEVYYSTKEAVRSDMQLLKSVTAGFGWKQYAYELPEGTRYFAIRYVGQDAFALMLDDVAYTPASASLEGVKITGYNVYRDGKLLNSVPVADTRFADSPAPGVHTWYVTVVYSNGESQLSNAVTDDPSDIGELVIDKDSPRPVYTLDGRYVTTVTSYGQLNSLPPAVYLVAAGKKAVKVVVR